MKIKFLLCVITFTLFSCDNEVIREIIKEPEIIERPDNNGLIFVSKDDYTEDNSKEIFLDEEDDDIFFKRKLKINLPLQVDIDINQNLNIIYYGPRNIKNVTIWAKLAGYEKEFKLANFEEIPSFIEYTVKLPMVVDTFEYITSDNKWIEILRNEYFTSEDFVFRIECDDSFYKQVTNMNYDVQITFGNYHIQGGNWVKMLPSHARESIALLMNMGYMFFSQEFSDSIMNHRFYSSDNESSIISNDVVISRAQRKGGGLNLGTTSGVDGLGGGNTLGVAEWQYIEHYADDKSQHEALFHEYAHCMGYGHSGNMTYNSYGDDKGFVNICRSVYERMSREKLLPVYSRRFLQTRKTRKTYGQSKYQEPKFVIEDPILDSIDGGLDEALNSESLDKHIKGESLNFIITHNDIPNISISEFQPKDVCSTENYLYLLNDAASNRSVEMFKVTNGEIRHHKSMREWRVNDEIESFNDALNGIGIGNGLLYVCRQDSRTDVFDAITLEYVTSIGTGSWGGGVNQIVHSFETIVRGNYVFLQDKQKINIYKQEDIIPGTKGKISRISMTNTIGNSKDVFGFDIDNNGFAYVAYAPMKSILLYDFSKFRQYSRLSSVKEWKMVNPVVDVVCWNNKLLGVQKSRPYLVEIDKTTGEIVRNFEHLHAFEKLEKISVSRGTLFCVDKNKKEVICFPLSMFE